MDKPQNLFTQKYFTTKQIQTKIFQIMVHSHTYNDNVICIVSCPSLSEPSNGTINCSLGGDGIPSYEDTCNFTCNTGYELTGSESRTCKSDGSWSGNITKCNRGKYDIYNYL